MCSKDEDMIPLDFGFLHKMSEASRSHHSQRHQATDHVFFAARIYQVQTCALCCGFLDLIHFSPCPLIPISVILLLGWFVSIAVPRQIYCKSGLNYNIPPQ